MRSFILSYKFPKITVEIKTIVVNNKHPDGEVYDRFPDGYDEKNDPAKNLYLLIELKNETKKEICSLPISYKKDSNGRFSTTTPNFRIGKLEKTPTGAQVVIYLENKERKVLEIRHP